MCKFERLVLGADYWVNLAKIVDLFKEKESGWALNEIINLDVSVDKLEFGNCVSSFINLFEQTN